MKERRDRIVKLAYVVREIKDARGITYSRIAAECGGPAMVADRISGLVNCHSLRSDLESSVEAWVGRNTK